MAIRDARVRNIHDAATTVAAGGRFLQLLLREDESRLTLMQLQVLLCPNKGDVYDIATKLGITSGSSSRVVSRLQGMGLVRWEGYGRVDLTSAGEEVVGRLAALYESRCKTIFSNTQLEQMPTCMNLVSSRFTALARRV